LGDHRKRPHPELVVCDHGDVSYARLAEKGTSEFKTVDRHRQDTAAILYTSGTTGIPKGAMLTHENLQTSIFNVAHYERSTQNDRALCFLPLNHVFAQIHIMNSTVFSGGGLVIQPAFDLEKVLEAIDRHQVIKFYAVPTIYTCCNSLCSISSEIAFMSPQRMHRVGQAILHAGSLLFFSLS